MSIVTLKIGDREILAESGKSRNQYENERKKLNEETRKALQNINTDQPPIHSMSISEIVEDEKENSLSWQRNQKVFSGDFQPSSNFGSTSLLVDQSSNGMENDQTTDQNLAHLNVKNNNHNYENEQPTDKNENIVSIETNDDEDYVSIELKTDIYPIKSIPQFCLKHINIGIIGRSGSGKSSFIKAWFDNKFTQDKRPQSSVIQMYGIEYYEYIDKNLIRIWDLPGYGTTQIPAKNYIEQYQLQYFDIVVLITSDRFNEYDNHIIYYLNNRNIPIPTFIVRMKIDMDLRNYKEDIHGNLSLNNEQLLKLKQDYMEQIINDFHQSCPYYEYLSLQHQNIYFLSKKKSFTFYNWLTFEKDVINCIFEHRKMSINDCNRLNFNGKMDEIEKQLNH